MLEPVFLETPFPEAVFLETMFLDTAYLETAFLEATFQETAFLDTRVHVTVYVRMREFFENSHVSVGAAAVDRRPAVSFILSGFSLLFKHTLEACG